MSSSSGSRGSLFLRSSVGMSPPSRYRLGSKPGATARSDRGVGKEKDQTPADAAASFGVGKLVRHLFICLGPDCADKEDGEETWKYLKRRMKDLNIAGPDGPCYRTKCDCLRICTDGPIAVVYPEGTWYRKVSPENA